MVQSLSKENSSILNCMRAFAIFSVICAHVNHVESTVSSMVISSTVLSVIGCGGVSAFFILSGFFFAYNKYSFKVFCKNKFISLVLPWIVTGTMVYLYTNIRKGSVSFLGLIKNLVGSGSYLWYMSVLLILYLVFFFLGKYKAFLIIAPIISVASFFVNKMIYPYIYSWGGDYLNFVNWMVFFWIGFILAKTDLMKKLINHVSHFKYFYMVLFFACLGALVFLNIEINYRTPLYFIYALVFFLACMSGATLVKTTKLFNYLGKDSFAIYLFHMPFVGIVAYMGNNYLSNCFFVLCRPFLSLCLVEIFVFLLRFIIKYLPLKTAKLIKSCIGIR